MAKWSLVTFVMVPMWAVLLMSMAMAEDGIVEVVHGGCFFDGHCENLDKGWFRQ